MFYTCSLIEYISRKTKNTKKLVIEKLGKENINKIYKLAEVYHCENIDKVSDEAKKLEKSAKAGRLGVEALKDKLGALPVVGQTLSRALDGVEGSFLSVAKAALPVAGIAGGLAAVGGAADSLRRFSKRRAAAGLCSGGRQSSLFERAGHAGRGCSV